MFFNTPDFDLTLFTFVNQTCHASWLNWIMELLSSKTAFFAVFAAAMVWMVRKYGRKQIALFLLILLAMGTTDLSTKFLKDAAGRVRPLNALAETRFVEDGQWQQRPANFVQTKEAGTSFPSAHSANSMCLAVLAILLWSRVGPSALGLPLMVGISRLYLGKHYPTDVLAGWLFGLVVAGFIYLIWKWFLEEAVLRRIPD